MLCIATVVSRMMFPFATVTAPSMAAAFVLCNVSLVRAMVSASVEMRVDVLCATGLAGVEMRVLSASSRSEM